MTGKISRLKRYEARALMKSIEYWQSVVNGQQKPKRPLAYYVNKLAFYSDSDIQLLKQKAV